MLMKITIAGHIVARFYLVVWPVTNKLAYFVSGKNFQPSFLFLSKARAYLNVLEPMNCIHKN